MDTSNALRAFAALSQETRLEALRLLLRSGERGLPAGEIARRLGVRQNTMSQNLSVLGAAGLTISRREGRSIRHSADFEAVRGLLGYLLEECCGGRPELCQPVIRGLARAG